MQRLAYDQYGTMYILLNYISIYSSIHTYIYVGYDRGAGPRLVAVPLQSSSRCVLRCLRLLASNGCHIFMVLVVLGAVLQVGS